MTARWMIYGAYGFTGELVARRAVAQGERPVLAGRDGERVRALAAELELDACVVALNDSVGLREALADVDVVAHCAGPFSATSEPMVDACLATSTHYLDITGEIAVFEAIHTRDAEARAADVTLLPGSGFDVVPTDCLAAMVAAELPGATQLDLAFQSGGGISQGTLGSALESLDSMSLARVDGAITPVPAGRRRGTITFGGRPTAVSAISWGDVATAFYSTGIGDITVYTPMPTALDVGARLASAAARTPVLDRVTHAALGALTRRIPVPSAAARARSGSEVWARASDGAGAVVTARLTTPNGYDLTADSVVRVATALANGDIEHGAHTPSSAFGAGFVRRLDGVTMVDEPHRH